MNYARVRVRLVTSHAIPAYGGIQLAEAMVEQVAEAVASGSIPMHFHHDISRPVHVVNVEAGTERLPDGHLAAWAEFDVDDSAWAAFRDELDIASAPGGMSISMTTPLDEPSAQSEASSLVAADAHHFSDEMIREAAVLLAAIDPTISGARLYQFSSIPDATIILDLLTPLVLTLGPNIAASIIWDATKAFFARGKGSVNLNIIMRQSRGGARKIQIQVRANTPEQLRDALKSLPDLIEAGAAGTFASTDGQELRRIETPAPPTADPEAAPSVPMEDDGAPA